MIAVEDTNLPRSVMFRGKRVRLVGYTPKTATVGARFVVLDTDDRRRSVARCFITFIGVHGNPDVNVGIPNITRKGVPK